MSFISYAQNYEDVVLWRALKHVEKGFYLDIGAWDPTIDSVTKAFYDAGWRGINIEPTQEWYTRLVTERPEDINLQTAVGNKNGSVKFYEVAGTGLSTIHEDYAHRSASENGFAVEQSLVPMRTLNSICEEHHVQEIHFLKVDAEGAESLVLQGLDLQKVRPWIILVEATIPGSQNENYADWEPLLLGNGYLFAYFDGLNRFYVAEEHLDLAKQLATPPNFFDDFVRWLDLLSIQELSALNSKLASIQFAKEKVETELNAVQTDRDRIWRKNNSLRSEKDQLEKELNSVLTDRARIWNDLDATVRSKSYRITKPFRDFAWFFRKLPGRIRNLRSHLKTAAFSTIHSIRMLPLLIPVFDAIKKALPGLWSRSRRNMLGITRDSGEQKKSEYSSKMYEDELYFLDLFQSEIAKSKQIKRGSS